MMVSRVVVASESLLELDIWKKTENPNNPTFIFSFFIAGVAVFLHAKPFKGPVGKGYFWMWWVEDFTTSADE